MIPDGIRNVYVSRKVQTRIDGYLSIVKEKACALNATVFAEEYNQEVHNAKRSQSTFFDVKEEIERATGREIHHLFIEPTDAEKRQRRYKEPEELKQLLEARTGRTPAEDEIYAHLIAHQFPIRERFWIERIDECLTSSILLVCGETHTYTFPKLLARRGVQCNVVAHGIGVEYTDKRDRGGIIFAEAASMFNGTACFCTQ